MNRTGSHGILLAYILGTAMHTREYDLRGEFAYCSSPARNWITFANYIINFTSVAKMSSGIWRRSKRSCVLLVFGRVVEIMSKQGLRANYYFNHSFTVHTTFSCLAILWWMTGRELSGMPRSIILICLVLLFAEQNCRKMFSAIHVL